MSRTGITGQGDIGRKIDFLMRVTGATNAQMARALSFDASYISRIRAGKRGLPSKLPFIEPAAAFFARNIREGYQAEAMVHELGLSGTWPTDKRKAAQLIAKWLERNYNENGDLGQGDAPLADDMSGINNLGS